MVKPVDGKVFDMKIYGERARVLTLIQSLCAPKELTVSRQIPTHSLSVFSMIY
jgi:hypothetical protein